MRTTKILTAMFLAACGGGTTAVVPVPEGESERRPVPPPEPPAPPAAWTPGFYPATAAADVTEEKLGVTVHDPYRWLEDAAKPEVKAWMAAQDQLAADTLAKLPAREMLTRRISELSHIDSITEPVHRGKRWFYWRHAAAADKPVLYWTDKKEGGSERVLLDPMQLSADGSTSVSSAVPSWDGKKLAYVAHPNNADAGVFHVRDVDTGKEDPADVVPGADFATAYWLPDGSGFVYLRMPSGDDVPVAERTGHMEGRCHRLGVEAGQDRLEHEGSGDAKKFGSIWLSDDGRWEVWTIEIADFADAWYRDLRKKDPQWAPLFVDRKARISVDAYRDRFYALTTDGAPNGRVILIDPAHPAPDRWQELIPKRKERTLVSAAVIGGKLVVREHKDSASALEIYSLQGKREREVELPALGEVGGISGRADEDELYFKFASFLVPDEIVALSVKTGVARVWAQVKVPFDSKRYTAERVFYASKDGTKVPMFLVHRSDLARDGNAPVVLYGYGGFNVATLPYFSPTLAPFLDAGGVWASVSLRGDGTYGDDWHKDGMLAKKQNVFDDFIAAAEWLIAEKVTRPERLAIMGGSNGGLLVGAVMTQRPELFRAVVCEVPLLDMIRYHLFGLARIWIPELGSADDPEGFKWLYAYSPYHRVKPGTKYPAVLMWSADSDDRVDPMHARKMTAALQAASTSGRPVILRIEPHSGHGGADKRAQAIQNRVERWSFLFDQLGISS